MKRIYIIGLTAALATWNAVVQLELPQPMNMIVIMAPLLLLVGFGAYMLLLLIYGAATFRSCPREAEALHKDIARARVDLAHRGYKFLDPQHNGVSTH